MKIKGIILGEGHSYKIILEDGTEWDLDYQGDDGDPWWELRLNMGTSDDANELRENGKAMVAFSHVVDAVNEILPDLEWESEDDDHELMYYANFNSGEVIELIAKI